jgi:hypothetical protein
MTSYFYFMIYCIPTLHLRTLTHLFPFRAKSRQPTVSLSLFPCQKLNGMSKKEGKQFREPSPLRSTANFKVATLLSISVLRTTLTGK